MTPRKRTRRGRKAVNNPKVEPDKFVYIETDEKQAGHWRGENGPQKSGKLSYDADELLKPKRLHVPPAPTKDRATEKGEHDEQQVMRVELLMLKGIKDKSQIMALLNITDYNQAKRFISRVYARWELTASSSTMRRHTGEALKRFELIEQELWSTINNNGGDQRLKVVALESVMKVNDRRLPLLGITPDTVRAMDQSDARRKHDERLEKQAALVEIATRFKALLAPPAAQESAHE